MFGKGVKLLPDTELNSTIKNLALAERKLTKEILLHIAEVDKRKLYLRMAYPSLYDYLTKEVGYSEGAAQRRIDAARLIAKIPEVSSKIESGDINLSQISKVQKICRQIKKTSGLAVDLSTQKQIFKRLENQSSVQTDFILANEFQMEVKQDTKISIQRDESQRLELTMTKEEMKLLKEAESLLSNKTGGGLKDTILEMAKKTIKENKPKEASTATVAVKTATISTDKIVKSKSGRHISLKLKKEVKQRDQTCQFVDIKTGRRCGAKHFLEIDHIEPRCQGGQNHKENLRVLCRSHNLFRYQKLL